MTYAELRVGAWFRCVEAPLQLLQKLEHCAITLDSKIAPIRDDVEVIEEAR